ncbi:hypothetical protein SB772_41965, partial [Paraburkholderia sp. SIMBA_030]
MNGQPTAENTRECGADGDLAAFRNWSNDAHVKDLARVWNVDPFSIPHYSPPTHVMQMMCMPKTAPSGCCGSAALTRPSRCPSW